MTLTLQQIAAYLGTAVPSGLAEDKTVSGYSIDTRTLQPGDLFFALPGSAQDGHVFVPQALREGAVAAVVERLVEDAAGPILTVPNVETALQQLARGVRIDWHGEMIAVTGSAGKTTTKDAIALVLSTALPTGKTVGNYNNHLGVPLSLLRLPDGCRAAVLEMGMNHAGEIAALCRIAEPRIGVVTNVGYAHVENFPDGIAGVARAKGELIAALPSDGVAVLNADDERVLAMRELHPGAILTYGLATTADVRAAEVEASGEGLAFTVDGVRFRTRMSGTHNVRNLLAVLAVARTMGISLATLPEAVAAFHPGAMRGERLACRGVTIWNDSYNANPEAMKAMLDVLRDTPAQRRIAVLGEMRELGAEAERLHYEVGEYAAQTGIDTLLAVRGAARYYLEGAAHRGLAASQAYFFDHAAEAGRALRDWTQPGDAVLFKGSRGTRVELALEQFVG